MDVFLVRIGPDLWLWSCVCGRIADQPEVDREVARISLHDHVRHAHPQPVAA